MTVAACTAYAANQYIKNRTDRFLDSGKMLQRVDSTDKLHDVFYASHKSGDNKKYAGLFGKQTIFGIPTGQNKNKMALKVNSGIKVASRQKAAETFQELMKNDKSFADAVKETANMGGIGGTQKQKTANKALLKAIENGDTKALTKKAYDGFNANLIGRGETADKFYNALKKKGYGAIEDMNDKKLSGFNADALIIFGGKDKISVESVSKLTDKEIQKGQQYFMNQQELKLYGSLGAAAGVMELGTAYINGGTTTKKKKGA